MSGRSRVSQGFTLIEILIVMAIVAILAAIAIPQYQKYTVRARITEGLTLAGAAKVAVVENSSNGMASLASGFVGLTRDSANVLAGNPAIDPASGEITISYTTAVAPAGANLLVLMPSSSGAILAAGAPPTDSIQWDCYAAGIPARGGRPAPVIVPTLDQNLAPAACR